MLPKDFTIFQTRTFGWLRFGCPTTLSTTIFSSFSGSEVDLQNFMAFCAHVKSHKRCQQTYNRIDRIRGTLAEDVFRSSANRLLIIAKEGCFIMFLDWNIRFPCDLSRMTVQSKYDLTCSVVPKDLSTDIFFHIKPSMDLWISRPSGRSLQWDLISQWFLFFNPHTTLPAGITRKFIANILLPKSRQIHPNVDWCFSVPSLTQVCIFFWISCPPTKCALSKLVFQTHLFHDVHPVQLSQNWKCHLLEAWSRKLRNLTIRATQQVTLRLDLRKVSMSFHTMQWKHHLHRFPAGAGDLTSFYGVFFMIFVASKWQKCSQDYGECNVDFPLKSIRCPKGFRVAQKQIWGGFSPKPRFLLTPNSSKSFESFLHLQSHHIRRPKFLKNCL